MSRQPPERPAAARGTGHADDRLHEDVEHGERREQPDQADHHDAIRRDHELRHRQQAGQDRDR